MGILSAVTRPPLPMDKSPKKQQKHHKKDKKEHKKDKKEHKKHKKEHKHKKQKKRNRSSSSSDEGSGPVKLSNFFDDGSAGQSSALRSVVTGKRFKRKDSSALAGPDQVRRENMLKHLNSDEVAQIALDKNSVAALEPTAALHRCPRCAAESVTAGIQQVAFLA